MRLKLYEDAIGATAQKKKGRRNSTPQDEPTDADWRLYRLVFSSFDMRLLPALLGCPNGDNANANPSTPQSAITGASQAGLARAHGARFKLSFEDFLSEQKTPDEKFWDGELRHLQSIDQLRDISDGVLSIPNAEVSLQTKSLWQAADKAIVSCCRGLKTSFDDVVKHLKAILNEDKRTKKREEAQKEKTAQEARTGRSRQSRRDQTPQNRGCPCSTAVPDRDHEVARGGGGLTVVLSQQDVKKLSACKWADPWHVVTCDGSTGGFGGPKLQRALALWGGQYKRTLAQAKLDCVTYAMKEEMGKNGVVSLFDSFLQEGDVVDVSSIAGGPGFMSSCWLFGCSADMKSMAHLPNHACMLKLLSAATCSFASVQC